MIYSLGELRPKIENNNFIASDANIIGDVSLSLNVSVWFSAVIRADVERIEIDEGVNIQDGAILHADPGFPLKISRNVTVGHKAVLHGCYIGESTLIGINSIVLNGAKVGKNCLIGANTLIPEHAIIPDGSVVLGSPGKVIRPIKKEEIKDILLSAEHYINNGKRFLSCLKEERSI